LEPIDLINERGLDFRGIGLDGFCSIEPAGRGISFPDGFLFDAKIRPTLDQSGELREGQTILLAAGSTESKTVGFSQGSRKEIGAKLKGLENANGREMCSTVFKSQISGTAECLAKSKEISLLLRCVGEPFHIAGPIVGCSERTRRGTEARVRIQVSAFLCGL
jgi:hypothetical protein